MEANMEKARRSGFTLIELLVVVLIIGILAAIAVPQYFKVVEKGKFAESMQWISSLKGAQERYLARYGVYATSTASNVVDVNMGVMSRFTASTITPTTTPNWTITLARNTPHPAVYGGYVVTYIAPPGSFTCSVQACTDELLP